MMEFENLVYSSDNDSDSDEEFCPYNVVDSLQQSSKPNLTSEEHKFMNAYTYDKEPVKEWRQVTDFEAIKECNMVKWRDISKLIGDFHGFRNSLALYKSKKLINVIERIICKNGCYYFPEKCFISHGYDLKNILRKSLHEELNPYFEKIFKDCDSKDVTLELTDFGAPKLLKLAEDIGFNTVLEYDEEDMLKINLSVLKEEFWMHKRPCFVKEEKKVLDVVHALLLSATKKRDAEISLAAQIYSQKMVGLNEPILKVMCHGPDYGTKEHAVDDIPCDITKDEEKLKNTGFTSVEHMDCKAFKKTDHWEYKHHRVDTEMSKCVENVGLNLNGPVSDMKTTSVFYPCNLQHCWICCKCNFCHLVRIRKCEHHREHIKYNIKECVVQQAAQCQEHWIDHPENFEAGDIEIENNLLFHNNEVKRDGRNYHNGSVKYPGLKVACKNCRKNTQDHYSNHLTPHLQCKHCLYELKTVEDKSYWKKVCQICGKVFSSEPLNIRHVKRHEFPKQECEICKITVSSKFNLHRHMIEQHNAMQDGHRQLKCCICLKTFLSRGKLGRHVQGVHRQMLSLQGVQNYLAEKQNVTDSDKTEENEFRCSVCDKVFTRKATLEEHQNMHQGEIKQNCEYCGKQFSTVSNLQRHLTVHTSKQKRFQCDRCQKNFTTKSRLDAHVQSFHESKKFNCDVCDKQFTTVSNLQRHLTVHTSNQKRFQCDRCQKNFTTKSSLDAHVQSFHENKKFSCELCDKSYSYLNKLKAHMNKCHK